MKFKSIKAVVFDFDGVFTDNSVYVSEDGSEGVRCFRGDGLGLGRLKKLGLDILILTSETNPVVSVRSRKLGVRCIQGCEDKLEILKNFTKESGITLNEVAYVGNDINDLSCLQAVGLPVVVQDAHPDVIPHAQYQTRARGGHGAVREICDLFESVLAPKKE